MPTSYALALEFPKGYIAHPYWPEREKLISIQKQSGINRARSEEKREKALATWLNAHEITMDDYRAIEIAANRPFYTLDGTPEIVIPAHQLYGMLAQTCDMAPAAVRLSRPEQVRNLVTCEDLPTGKMGADGAWERFVVVKSGTGQALSNQRGLRIDSYIEKFTASGKIHLFDPEQQDKLLLMLEFAGQEIGVGASRKMGWGRFKVTTFKRLN